MTYAHERELPLQGWSYYIKFVNKNSIVVYNEISFTSNESSPTIEEFLSKQRSLFDGGTYTAVAFRERIKEGDTKYLENEVILRWSDTLYVDYDISHATGRLQDFLLESGMIEQPKTGKLENKQPVKEDMGQGFRPEYYGGDKNVYEPIKIIQHYQLPFESGIALKHLLRRGNKEGNSLIVDLQKAITYLQFEVDYLLKQDEQNAVFHSVHNS